MHRVGGLVGHGGQATKDFAASFRLGDQQIGVVFDARRRRLPGEFLGHNRDGGQGRSQFMGGGGGESAKSGQSLFPRQDGLGHVERQGHARGLHHGLAHKPGDEGDPGHIRHARDQPVLQTQPHDRSRDRIG